MKTQTIGRGFRSEGWIDPAPIGELVIGDLVVLGNGSRIISHGPVRPWKYPRIEIGDLCYIGDGARILLGADIGRGSVVGTLSVVTGEIPPFSIVAGNPARVIRQRDPIELLRTYILKHLEASPVILGAKLCPDWRLLSEGDIEFVLEGWGGEGFRDIEEIYAEVEGLRRLDLDFKRVVG